MAARVFVPPAVLEQIEEAGAYVAEDSLPDALKLMDRLLERCHSLDLFPERGVPYRDRFRRVFEGSYQIIYRVEAGEDETIVVIVAVHHTSRREPGL